MIKSDLVLTLQPTDTLKERIILLKISIQESMDWFESSPYYVAQVEELEFTFSLIRISRHLFKAEVILIDSQ
jgi:hypothetical protein